ncbi:sugar porter family MFS transporter [Rhodohalobacter sulfatireducens]|uniref:Sugar porter family MFS transporter n=1 Tax=Rhodohalobacter sulfatireducens TaxID=2911366 RepID=A0ABS9KEQ2_9BACT|nr:sugar porter family MFS transporter [Rhodohalobacter sulfatireducens]MCG2589282.1 sugar porter family MFS transporter [Rhodohalobacter sulfatireducens]
MIKTKSIALSAIAASLAGFLFGFDTIVISGADQPIQELWQMSDLFHGTFIMSMALWGTVIGALFGGIPCDKYGRRKTLFWIGILYFVSAVGSGLAPNPYIFSIARFIGGLGVGASSVAAPIYISEITPANNRGKLVALYQFNIVFGILIAYLSNYWIGASFGENAWRWMLGVEGIPAAIYCFFVLGIPESPRWLAIKQNNESLAKKILQQLNPKENIEKLMREIKSSVSSDPEASKFFSGRFKFPIMLAFLLAFFNQLSGINFVLYYAPRIFEQAGIAATEVLGASVPIGIVNLIFTLLGMYLIDRAGRKLLMYVGSFGYIASLLGVAWAFSTGAEGVIVVAFVTAFVASHAIGQGAVIWVFISEIFPNAVRDYGMSLGSSTHWIFAALITLLTPTVLSTFSGAQIFSFFAFMMFLQLLFVWKLMPETKNITLEEMEVKLGISREVLEEVVDKEEL